MKPPLKIRKLAAAIELLQAGLRLHRTNTADGVIWSIEPGHEISELVAKLLLVRKELHAEEDGLLHGLTQTWSWSEPSDTHARRRA